MKILNSLTSHYEDFIDRINEFFVDRKSIVVNTIDGLQSNGNKYLTIFAHYDQDDIIDPYVIYFLDQLLELGSDIIFVTACDNFSYAELEKLKQRCTLIIQKNNIGRDFGNWKIGIDSIDDITKYQKLILTNDSSYGPLFNLKSIAQNMEEKNYDLWGITDSTEQVYHLQSYFLAFDNSIFHGKSFEKFWKKYKYYSSRNLIINKYEFGLTQKFLKNFTIGALCQFDQLKEKYNPEAINPTHHLWKELIVHENCPFIKRELLQKNPYQLDSIQQWKEVIKNNTEYDINLIVNHLNRIKNN